MKLIDKDVLTEKLWERRIKHRDFGGSPYSEYGHEDDEILSLINTLEVREVDLDFQRFAKEMDAIFALPSSKTKNTEENQLNWEFVIAKHFFELGLKAQKEE